MNSEAEKKFASSNDVVIRWKKSKHKQTKSRKNKSILKNKKNKTLTAFFFIIYYSMSKNQFIIIIELNLVLREVLLNIKCIDFIVNNIFNTYVYVILQFCCFFFVIFYLVHVKFSVFFSIYLVTFILHKV
jgi:hypothetical protein